MRFSSVFVLAFAAFVMALPVKRHTGTSFLFLISVCLRLTMGYVADSDDSIVYPDEKLYAEEYKKREVHDSDDRIIYPDEKLYAEEYKKRATTTAGFFAGRFYSLRSPTSRRMHGSPPPIIELNPVTVTSKSNRTYLERPSPENDKLWEALYPKGHHCLFEWPNENPKRAGFAGFHQLHCVKDALRKGFYQDHDVKQALLRGEDISDIPQPIDMVHVLHCVEFLRQSIICHADTSLQLSNPIIREYLPLALRTLAEIGGRW
ncbi:hypothetical protein G7Y89_g4254 [Cudoniella acicularis]|uniref:Uncharacterized protein n=1 Tax=Cudoniella acicularis TaxID=354080 RepID=A0A8H4RR87_9HELO|nr:hypothetical protein G7Y89_g4254 [Cudoniella acicularis]